MKKVLGLVLSLTLISGVCAAVLAYVNGVTHDRIGAAQAQMAIDSARAVLPTEAVGAVAGVLPSGETFYTGTNATGDVVGYAVAGSDSHGYGGEIVLMVGLRADKRTVVCYRTLSASETPGLGMNLKSPEFASQFAGKPAANLRVKKDGGEIEAITAATITSRAVCRAIESASQKLSR